MKINTILFPVDLSENASKIVPYVLSMAQPHQSRVYLLHVVHDLLRWGKVYTPHPSLEAFQDEAVKEAGKAVDKFCQEHLKDLDHEMKVVSGDPASEILRVIESEDIDLVVMGTHGRRGVEHILMGSVAENVAKRASVPVMTVNPHKVT